MEYKKSIDTNNIAKLSASEQDKIKVRGSLAENLINNVDLQTFVIDYKKTLYKELTAIQGYTNEHDAKRLAITQQIVGIEGFVDYLAKQVDNKNKVVNLQGPTI